MKNLKLSFCIVLLLCCSNLRAQDTIPNWNDSGAVNLDAIMVNAFAPLDLSQAATGYLQDKGICFFSDSLYGGDTLDSTNLVEYNTFLSMYSSVMTWRTNDQGMVSVNELKQTWANNTNSETLAVAIQHIAYNAFKPDIISNNLIEVIANQYHDVTNRSTSPYQNKHLVAATTNTHEHYDLNCTFYFPNNLAYIDNGMALGQLQVDFGDGNGYQNLSFGNHKAISYNSPGEKEISYKLDYGSGNVFYTHSVLTIINNSFQSEYQEFGDYQQEFAPLAGSNGHSGAVVTVDLGCEHDELIKPLIIVEGYDPDHSIGVPSSGFKSIGFIGYDDAFGILQRDEAGSIEDDLSDGSFDIVFVDFYDGVDDIKRNARLLEEVIEWVNTTKAQNHSQEPNVVIGFSMGGIVARWALKTMENNNEDHDTRLYVSFDSPHRGAYVPISIQYMIRHLASLSLFGQKLTDSNQELADAVSMLDAPATKQLLLYQSHEFSGNNPHGSATINGVHHPNGGVNNQDFLDDLDNLGYPEECRMIAVANGSQINVEQEENGVALGDNALLLQIDNADAFATAWLGLIFPNYMPGQWGATIYLGRGYKMFFDISALPDQSQGKRDVYYGKITYSRFGVGLWNLTKATIRYQGTDCMEQKPGGIFDPAAFNVDLSAATSIPGTTLNFSKFCFIPTISSLAVNTPTAHDYNYHIKNADILNPANKRTPFFSYMAPDGTISNTVGNEAHVAFSPYNTGQLVDETIDGLSNDIDNFSYNIGNSDEFQIQNLIGNVDILNNGILFLNKYDEIGVVGNGNNSTENNSFIDVYVGGSVCTTSTKKTLTIKTTGKLIVGDAVNGNSANLTVTQGGSLILEGGSELQIEDGSQLIINSGGVLKIEQSSAIVLSGSNSVLKVHGSLEIDDNGTLTFTGTGKVIFNSAIPNNITFGQNAKIELIGSGPTDVIAEIDQSDLYALTNNNASQGGNSIKFKNGKVLMADDARLATDLPITIDNVLFEPIFGTEVPRGIYLYGQTGVDISNSTFKGMRHGIKSEAYYGTEPLEIEDCDFEDCQFGVTTWGRGANLVDCDFSNCGIGWNAEFMTEPSSFNECDVDNSTSDGIVYKGGISPLLISYASITNNANAGVIYQADALSAHCSDIENNRIGIQMMGGELLLSRLTKRATGYVDFQDNNYSITGFITRLDLQDGYNHLEADQLWRNDRLDLGIAMPSVFNSPQVFCDYNQWSSFTTTPNTNSPRPNLAPDRNILAKTGTNFPYITDVPFQYTHTISTTPECGVLVGGGGPGEPGMSTDYARSLMNNPEIPIQMLDFVNTINVQNHEFQGVNVEEAVNISVTDMYFQDTDPDRYEDALNRLADILLVVDYSEDDGYINFLTEYAYGRMMEAFDHVLADDKIIAQTLSVKIFDVQNRMIELLEAKNSNSTYYGEFKFNMDYALTHHALDDRTSALSHLNNMLVDYTDNELLTITNVICKIQFEKDVIAGTISILDTEQEGMNTCGEEIIWPEVPTGGATSIESAERITDHQIAHYPNPSKKESYIKLTSEDKEWVSYQLLDLSGKLLKQSKAQWLSNDEIMTVDQSGLEAGSYILLVRVGASQQRIKVMIQ